jgi:hypothetical protein
MKRLATVAFAGAVLTSTVPAQGIFLSEAFNDNSNGWTLDTEWAIGAAASSSGETYGGPDPSFDACGVTAGGIAGVVIGGNANDVVHAPYWITSPTLDTSGAPSLWISFDRWLNSDYTRYMQNFVQVFDGSTWQTVWQSGGSPGVQDSSWQRKSYDVSAHANANFQVRFGFDIGSSGVFDVSSWNLDNVVVSVDEIPAPVSSLAETFDDNSAGWILGPEWEIGAATASSGENYGNPDPAFDATGVVGGGVAGVVIGGNASTSSTHGFYWLTSPEIDGNAIVGTAYFTYDRFLNSDYASFMVNRVDVFDGTGWVNLWITVQDTSWTRQGFDVTTYKNRCMRVRFGFNIGSSGVYTVSSWNVDNVRVGHEATATAATAPCGTPAPTLAGTLPLLGQPTSITLTSGVPNTAGLLLIGFQTPPIPVVGSSCTVDVGAFTYILFPTDAAGGWTFPAVLPLDILLDGATLDLQALMLSGTGLSTSNVLHLDFGFSG